MVCYLTLGVKYMRRLTLFMKTTNQHTYIVRMENLRLDLGGGGSALQLCALVKCQNLQLQHT